MISRDNIDVVGRATKILASLPKTAKRFTWKFRQIDLMKQAAGGGIDNFLSWPIVSESLYAGYTPISEGERRLLPGRYCNLAIDHRSPPPPLPLSPEGASGTYIKQVLLAYALQRFILPPFGWPSIKTVYEVGGGYGAMAVVLRRMAFSGEHFVLDFPALHLIREWYLADLSIRTKSVTEVESTDVDVLIASHSLCEIDTGYRAEILGKVRAKHYVFSITRYFDGVDNSAWFRGWLMSEEIQFVDYFPGISGNQDIMVGSRLGPIGETA